MKPLTEEERRVIVDKDGKLPAHSKTHFAEMILHKKSGFDDFDVSNFKLIFNLIETVLRQ